MVGGFSATMRSAVVLISRSVVDVWSWLSTLLESQFWNLRECKNKAISLMFCMRLISLYCQKTAYGLVWNVTGLQPANPLSPAPFTAGYGVETNDISDYVWTIAFIQGFKKDIYKRNISLFWVGREGHNEQTISFPMKWRVVSPSHFCYCGKQSKKTVIIKWFSGKDFNSRLKESFSKNYILLNKSMHSILLFCRHQRVWDTNT